MKPIFIFLCFCGHGLAEIVGTKSITILLEDGKDFECYFWEMDIWNPKTKYLVHSHSYTWNGLVQVSFEELTGNGVEGDLMIHDDYTRKSDWNYLDKHHDDAHVLTEYKGILWTHIKIPLDERKQLDKDILNTGGHDEGHEDPLSAKVCFLNRHSGERKIRFKITQLSEENVPKLIMEMADTPEQAEAHREFLNGFMFSSLYTDTDFESFLNILQHHEKTL